MASTARADEEIAVPAAAAAAQVPNNPAAEGPNNPAGAEAPNNHGLPEWTTDNDFAQALSLAGYAILLFGTIVGIAMKWTAQRFHCNSFGGLLAWAILINILCVQSTALLGKGIKSWGGRPRKWPIILNFLGRAVGGPLIILLFALLCGIQQALCSVELECPNGLVHQPRRS
ncbi:hypothetical protein W97_09290 [Coniosporium apollinis CBS 100218]|uniref:Uncharacterized protein n=1 Tax=Coniosporium apollinis (strain CBS 100218) TaxID=1168221 RepID=R7Z7L9_CONA1|nr:uncharacterized protein W97_09290 [Coniosporium apollinis CBS 100218]EON70024.1 hypothetical protein W97_09290 [Coniosporium apollinis CBS 100218]